MLYWQYSLLTVRSRLCTLQSKNKKAPLESMTLSLRMSASIKTIHTICQRHDRLPSPQTGEWGEIVIRVLQADVLALCLFCIQVHITQNLSLISLVFVRVYGIVSKCILSFLNNGRVFVYSLPLQIGFSIDILWNLYTSMQ